MSTDGYPAATTGLLIVDPYNDFVAEDGKIWPMARETAEAVGFKPNLKRLIAAARAASVQVFIVPHHRYSEGCFHGWKFMSPSQQGVEQYRVFEAGTKGGEFHPDFAPQPGDVVIQEHWTSSGFANTDLDLQLKQRGIDRIVLAGMMANTCLESTGRFGVELGYHVTLVKDATAATSWEAMKAAVEVNFPTFAHAVLDTDEVIAALHSPALAAA